MNDGETIEKYYQSEAENIVNMIYEAELFDPKLTRSGLQAVEDIIAYYMQSHARTAKRCAEAIMRIEKMK